jgi:hypothetical protein
MDLMSREANKRHEWRAGRFLAHSTIADAGAISRSRGSIAYSAALTASDIIHGVFPWLEPNVVNDDATQAK